MQSLIYTLAIGGCLFLNVISSQAEYRVYQLEITNSESGVSRTLQSTLGPLQYSGYHPLAANEVISYLDSWMCYGNSSHFQPLCPKPEDQEKVPGPEQKPKTP
jgi:hypothetical protein